MAARIFERRDLHAAAAEPATSEAARGGGAKIAGGTFTFNEESRELLGRVLVRFSRPRPRLRKILAAHEASLVRLD